MAVAIETLLGAGPDALIVKRGIEGADVHLVSGEVIHGAPFPVEVYNTLGAGDAFASGFIYGNLSGWSWEKSARLGNATGAIVVTRHGCALTLCQRCPKLMNLSPNAADGKRDYCDLYGYMLVTESIHHFIILSLNNLKMR